MAGFPERASRAPVVLRLSAAACAVLAGAAMGVGAAHASGALAPEKAIVTGPAQPTFAPPPPPPVKEQRLVDFRSPLRGVRVNSVFGLRKLAGEKARMHEGLDYAAPTGTPVEACAEGRVVKTGNSPTYGRYVEVEHANGVTSFYAHLSRVAGHVRPGSILAEGETLGAVGSTGHSTGPHLHFEIRSGGERLDPARFLNRSFAALDLPSAVRADAGLTYASADRSVSAAADRNLRRRQYALLGTAAGR